MLPFLSNVNDLVSSDDKYEVETMMADIPKISKAVTNYVSHRLCENFNFSPINRMVISYIVAPLS